MSENNEVVQFSIYKINLERVKEKLDITKNISVIELKDNIISYIRNYIKKGNDNVLISDYDDFSLMLIKSKRNPIWKTMVEKMIKDGNVVEDIIDRDILNMSTSYILVAIVEKKIYVMTGGRGANYINKFIEKNYGLYLIPKIVDKNNPIIKKIVENNISGNNLSTERITKNATSVSTENRLGSIYRELSVQVSKDIAKKIGVAGIEGNKQIAISTGDSIVIRKSISLNELKTILKTLSNLEKKKDNFILNYFVPIHKKGIKGSDLKKILIEKIKSEEYDDFQILSDKISEYYFTASKYIIKENEKIIFEKETPITLEDVVEIFKDEKGKLHKNKIAAMLDKCDLEAIDEYGEYVTEPEKIFDLLRGSFEDSGNCFYLLNGAWYIFEEHFFDMIDDEYKNLYDQIKPLADEILDKFKLVKKDVKNEDIYNDCFKSNKHIIKAHKKEIKFIELADLIFFDEKNTYLMCNKGSFTGAHVRDLENQILTASKMIETVRKSDKDYLKDYYKRLEESEKLKITLEEFIKIFEKNIVFIAGFLEGYKKKTKSPYAKYLLNDLNKNLEMSGFKLIIANYKEK